MSISSLTKESQIPTLKVSLTLKHSKGLAFPSMPTRLLYAGLQNQRMTNSIKAKNRCS